MLVLVAAECIDEQESRNFKEDLQLYQGKTNRTFFKAVAYLHWASGAGSRLMFKNGRVNRRQSEGELSEGLSVSNRGEHR